MSQDLNSFLPSKADKIRGMNLATAEDTNELRRSIRVASGHIHFGHAHPSASAEVDASVASVNDGLWMVVNRDTILNSQRDLTNTFFLGDGLNSNTIGKTFNVNPVVDIGGEIFHIDYLNAEIVDGKRVNQNQIPLMSAPDGRDTYDRETGVMVRHAESQMAFDGIGTNSNFRNGSQDWTNGSNGAVVVVADGKLTITTNGSSNAQVGNTQIYQNTVANTDYVVEIYLEDTNGAPSIWYDTTGGNVHIPLHMGLNRITIQSDRDNFNVQLQPKGAASGSYATIRKFAVHKKSVENLIRAVDMVTYETWFEEITAENPWMYNQGVIQSRPNNIEGIDPVVSTRPDSYYANFQGDDSGRGFCLNYWELTEDQRQSVHDNAKHKLVMMGRGRVGQWRIRAKSRRCPVNGDWLRMFPWSKANKGRSLGACMLEDGAIINAEVQGKLDTANDFYDRSGDVQIYVGPNLQDWNKGMEDKVDRMVYMAQDGNGNGTNRSDNGLAYCSILATIPRLNSGAYHEGLNPYGTAWPRNAAATTVVDWQEWDNGFTVGDCFDLTRIGWVSTGHTGPATSWNGSVKDNVSNVRPARPDGKYHDVVYPEGQGGIIDWRMGCEESCTVERVNEVRTLVRAGDYRGVERPTITQPLYPNTSTSCIWIADNSVSVGSELRIYSSEHPADIARTDINMNGTKMGDRVDLFNEDFWIRGEVNYLQYENNDQTAVLQGVKFRITHVERFTSISEHFVPSGTGYYSPKKPMLVSGIARSDTSVSGRYLRCDHYGPYSETAKIDPFKYGWFGGTCKSIVGQDSNWPLTRRYKDSRNWRRFTMTQDMGATWTANDLYNSTPQIGGLADTGINSLEYGLWNYLAWANMTTQYGSGVDDESAPEAFGGVTVTDVEYFAVWYDRYGAYLMESMVGMYSTDPSFEGSGMATVAIDSKTIRPFSRVVDPDEFFRPKVKMPEWRQAAVDPGVRYIPYATALENMASIGYLYEQLIWDNDMDNSTNEFIQVTVDQVVDWEAGKLYRVTGGDVQYVVRSLFNVTAQPLAGYRRTSEGFVSNSGVLYFEDWKGNGFGARTEMLISSGSRLMTDLNNALVRVGNDVLSIPMGPTARI